MEDSIAVLAHYSTIGKTITNLDFQQNLVNLPSFFSSTEHQPNYFDSADTNLVSQNDLQMWAILD